MTAGEPPIAVRRPLMVHRWTDIAFVHWPYRVQAVQQLLPEGLEADTFDGVAWVGLIPFVLTVFPLVHAAPEVNLRTYVRGPDGGRGIYFFSLEIGRPLAALVARAGYGIPYMWSEVRVERKPGALVYTSRRRRPGPPAAARLNIEPGPSLGDDVSDLDLFLTARFTLYAGARRLRTAQVEHPAWALRCARARVEEDLTTAAGLPKPVGEPHTLYSLGTRALFGAPRSLCVASSGTARAATV